MKKFFVALGILGLATMATSLTIHQYTQTQAESDIQRHLEHYYMPLDTTAGNDPDVLGKFAWEQMLAINWAATYDGISNKKRGVPDSVNWSYINHGQPHTVVWETFAHRTELRPAHTGSTTDFDKIKPDNSIPGNQYGFHNAPQYTFGSLGESVTINSKNANMNLLNCLDEDNEIGSCILFNDSGTDVKNLDNLILYQAKINEAGFNYKSQYFNGYDKLKKKTKIQEAIARVKLPMPDKELLKKYPTVDEYRKQYQMKHSTTLDRIAVCDEDRQVTTKNKTICLPCSDVKYPIINKMGKKIGISATPSEGVIEIKTAWRRYNKNKDKNIQHYFHRQAIYFTKDPIKNEYIAHNDMFLLIGMHVIRKTKNHPTFIISTFEHESVTKDNYNYVSTPGGDGDYDELYKINKAKRDHSYLETYQDINDDVHGVLKSLSPKHYLNHYNLVGVQGQYETGYPLNNTALNPDPDTNSFFLSNYVIESDNALSNFYGSFGQPQKGNQDGFFNTINPGGQVLTTGGCKGCHGAAQTTGKDMSFLMDGLKPVDHPDVGLLSTDVIKTNYFTAQSLVENKNNIFLTTEIDKKGMPSGIRGRVSSFKVPIKSPKYSGIGVNPYLQDKYPPKFKDFDGYPRANIQFMGASKIVNGVGTGIIHIKDIQDGYITTKMLTANQAGFRVTKNQNDATMFKINILNDGYITLESMEGYPVIMRSYDDRESGNTDPKTEAIIQKGKLQYILLFSTNKNDTPIRLQAYGFTTDEFKAIQ